MSDEKRYKVTNRATGKVHYLTAAELARMTRRSAPRIDTGKVANDVESERKGRTTFRRDRLRRLAEKGKLVAIDSYHYDEMTGSSRLGRELPVRMRPQDWSDRKEGFVYLTPFDFETSSGRAWTNPDGTVTLYVHSNENYTFRVLGKYERRKR